MSEEAVPVSISSAALKQCIPVSFIETGMYEHMSKLLTNYMSSADVRYMISELKDEFFSGFTSLNSQQLHTIIQHCVKCKNVPHPPVLPSWNCIDPDLMVIAENPASLGAQSKFLTDTMKDVGFKSDRCMLTYAVRCKASTIDQINVDNCVPYLHTEVAVLNPKLIITLGLGSFQYLTGDKTSRLVDIKGTIRWWGPYAVLPEISLGSLYHLKEKGQNAQLAFKASFEKAHKYLY